jgi:hypothetical protein
MDSQSEEHVQNHEVERRDWTIRGKTNNLLYQEHQKRYCTHSSIEFISALIISGLISFHK